jgi:hypothetical protein
MLLGDHVTRALIDVIDVIDAVNPTCVTSCRNAEHIKDQIFQNTRHKEAKKQRRAGIIARRQGWLNLMTNATTSLPAKPEPRKKYGDKQHQRLQVRFHARRCTIIAMDVLRI